MTEYAKALLRSRCSSDYMRQLHRFSDNSPQSQGCRNTMSCLMCDDMEGDTPQMPPKGLGSLSHTDRAFRWRDPRMSSSNKTESTFTGYQDGIVRQEQRRCQLSLCHVHIRTLATPWGSAIKPLAACEAVLRCFSITLVCRLRTCRSANMRALVTVSEDVDWCKTHTHTHTHTCSGRLQKADPFNKYENHSMTW